MSAGSDPEAYMKPALGGNLGMLNSVLKHGCASWGWDVEPC